MRARVFAPLRNTPGRHDATGAFLPDAHAFLRVNALPGGVHLFDPAVPLAERREQVQRALLYAQCIDVVAVFCHGWRDGLQAGYRLGDVPALGAALKACAAPWLTVVLYACDTARDSDEDREDDRQPGPGGEGGFADALRDELRRLEVSATVYAHATEGHATSNPYVRRFSTNDTPGEGAPWVVEPGSAGWGTWRRDLQGDRRFTFWREA